MHYKSPEYTSTRVGYALLGVPLAEELDLLAKLGDVLGESLNRGHFVVCWVLREPQGTFWRVNGRRGRWGPVRRLHTPSLV